VTKEDLSAFLADHVEEGSIVITDGWQSYPPAIAGKYLHKRLVVPKKLAGDMLPGVHRVSSLCKRWLLGTHQGSVDALICPAT
jgi:hypothetical protein